MIYIRNMRTIRWKPVMGAYHVRVDRTSPLGNPYPMLGHSQRERDEVCNAYANWYGIQMAEPGGPMRRERDRLLELARTGDLYLYCWCAPKRCHAETIKADLEQALMK